MVLPAGDDASAGKGMDPATTDHTQAQVEARLDLNVYLAKLPEDQRMVLVLREIEGLSYAQIAQLLQLPAGTVESRLHRARTALRQLLGEESRQGDGT
ncbi:MAG: sigma-70 family RNA polymerase sigma factor [Phycisphaerales bacterium]|nr:sigma-70 family RNA polymerase sigma factor [Phycisphaerales bacterium]